MGLAPEWDKGIVWGIVLSILAVLGLVYATDGATWYWVLLPVAGWLVFYYWVDMQKAK